MLKNKVNYKSAVISSALALATLPTLGAIQAKAVQFQTGDVVASISNGMLQVYDNNLNPGTILDTTQGGYTTGSTTDSAGNLYVTNFSANSVSKFDSNGNLLPLFATGLSTPESIIFNKAGDAFVSSVGGQGIYELDSTGKIINQFSIGRTDWIDLSADQTTIYYTNEGTSVGIGRFDIATNTALPDLVPESALNHPYALRILSSGNVLVADTSDVKEFSSSGTLIKTYAIPNASAIFSLNLDPNGTSFWTGDANNGNIFDVDIASGNILKSGNTGTGSGTFFGLSVYGEITAGGGGVGGGGGGTTTTPEHSSPLALLALGVLGIFTSLRSQSKSSKKV